MFKPLLRTIPTLSGNVTLSCKLNEIVKDSSNEFHTYVRMGNLMPLQNNMFDKNIELNLLNGKYEYDIARFYNVYSNVFYNENFTYNKRNYSLLNLDALYESSNDARNKDYEFGCKRIKYSQSGYQFSFYAPFYIDDPNDLPNYFCIHIKFNDHLEKVIKVLIDDDVKTNYLGAYLKKYLKQIDDRVIFCLPDSLQATYFGIDVKSGGIVQYIDNEIGSLYVNQTTINNFDYTICQGFERNRLVMPQVCPLSFMFNINDLLTEYEKKSLCGYKVSIYGYYCSKNNNEYPFYDFDINYTHSFNKYLKYDEYTGKYNFSFGTSESKEKINILNVGYPALNESKYIKYAYTNKITPRYCKFKMLHSSDDDPYITNLNFGYTYLQNPNQKYGYFPTMFKGIYPQAYLKGKDLRLPIGNDMETYYKTSKYYANNVQTDTTNIDKYNKLMTNYTSAWYNINHKLTLDVFNDDSLWDDVTYNYSYHHGILYNLKDLKEYNIDKFSIFINPELSYVNESKFINSLVRAKYVLSKTDASTNIISNYNDAYNMNVEGTLGNDTITYSNKIYDLSSNIGSSSYLMMNKVMIQDDHGKYVEEQNYEAENTYYRYNEIVNIISNYINNDDIISDLSQRKINGYKILDGVNSINYFETYTNVYGENQKRFMLYNELFNNSNPSKRFGWLLDSLYYVDNRSSDKRQVKTIYNKIDPNEDIYGKIAIFLTDEFVHINDVYNIILKYESTINNASNIFTNKIPSIVKYAYVQYSEDNDLLLKDYFMPLSQSYSDVYVDTYNLNKLITLYNEESLIADKLNLINESDVALDMFIKIINKDHLIEYCKQLNKDENGNSPLSNKLINDSSNSILNAIYVKQRNWVIEEGVMKPKDTYITLNEFITTYPIRYDKKWEDEERQIYSDEYQALLDLANNYDTVYKSYTNNKILDLLCNLLSDTRSLNGKFTLQIIDELASVDLCIKKKVISLNNKLMKLMYNGSEIKNYLYLYIKDSCKNDNNDIWPVLSNNEINKLNNREIDNYLVPLFTSPYVNDLDTSTLQSMVSKNKIKNYKYVFNEGKYFKEIDLLNTLKNLVDSSQISTINQLIDSNGLHNDWYNYALGMIGNDPVKNELYINFSKDIYDESNADEIKEYIDIKLEFLNENLNDLIYILAKNNKITLYSIYDIMDIKYNMIDTDIEDIIYDEKYNVYIYKNGDVTYGFYYLNFTFDNTNNSFNLINDYNLNVQFDMINGKAINESNNAYFDSIFPILQPFLKVNLFNEFSKDIPMISYPYEAEILIKYVPTIATEDEIRRFKMLKDKDTDVLYSNIVKLNVDKKIKLLRYFNYITPYLKETFTIKDVWELKFMKPNNFEDLEKDSIFERNDINIYKYNGIKAYYGIYDKLLLEYESCDTVMQNEYKHFNDNLLYNLPEEITVIDDNYYSFDDIQILKDKNILNDKKLQILLRFFNKKKLDYKDIILFLYNKYDSSIFIEKTHLNAVKSEYKYRISYKFTLI